MKKYLAIALPLVVVTCTISAVFVFNTTNTMAQTLNANITNMMNNIESGASSDLKTQLSSNPYDYAKNNVHFDKIVNIGPSVLPLIEDYINKSSNLGLTEYLLAIAAEKIAKVDLKSDNAGDKYGWTTGKEFAEAFDKHLKKIPSSVDSILSSGETQNGKIDDLEKLGIPAIPYVIDKFDLGNPEQQQVIASVLYDLQKDSSLAKFESKNIDDVKSWISTNKAKFSDIKDYVDSKASN